MQKLLLICIFTLTLFGNNPNVYTQIGDPIYNNVNNIKSLRTVPSSKRIKVKIESYIKDVEKAKIFAFEIQSGAKSNLKLQYLEEIRRLSKINDYFIRAAKSSFNIAIKNQDNDSFISLVNSGLIDVDKKKRQIMNYYKLHKDSIKSDGIIQDWVDEEYAIKHKKRWKPKTKAQLQKEKIQRLRANDKLKMEALEKKLDNEVRLKKEKIRAEQERELFN